MNSSVHRSPARQEVLKHEKLPETNSKFAPEKGIKWQREINLPTIDFQGEAVIISARVLLTGAVLN